MTAALTALVLVACQQNPATPQADAPLQLDSLRLELAPSGEVLVARGFTHGTASASSEVSIPIQFSTTGGDVEDPMGHWTTCYRSDGWAYACHQLIYMMVNGHAPTEIAPVLHTLGMRIFYSFGPTATGAVQVLRGTDAAAFRALASVPYVGFVGYNMIVYAAGAAENPDSREVSVALPVNRSAVSAGNGALELQPGQTVTAEYQQPDGSVLTATLHM